jgi:hypothetical protein
MVEAKELEALRFCGFCPNLCRSAWPATAHVQTETVTPSAMALLAVAVIDKRVAVDRDVVAALEQTAMARTCRSACPYRHDIAGIVERLTARIGT